jgi:hypothetical protein
MKPKIELPPAGAPETQQPHITLQAVAFYTDTEHRVEPITDGVRIILQFDVELDNWSISKRALDTTAETGEQHARKKHKPEAWHAYGVNEDDDDNIDSDDEGMDDTPLEDHKTLYEHRKAVIPKSLLVGDPAVVDEIVDIIRGLLAVKEKGVENEVAFPLQYLYRKASILPEYLKGSDSLLYQALSKTFEVSLYPVVLQETTDGDGRYGTRNAHFAAYIFTHEGDPDEVKSGDKNDGEDKANEDKGNNDSPSDADEGLMRHEVTFYLPRSSAIQTISRQGYVEHAGNEAILGDGKYFGGGMFVKLKAAGNV